MTSFLLAIRQRNAPECAHKISNVLGACLEHIPSPCFGRIFRVIGPNPAVVGHFCNGAHQRNFNALKSHGLKACGLHLVGYRLGRHILYAVPVHQRWVHRKDARSFLSAAVTALPRRIQIPRHQPPIHFSQHISDEDSEETVEDKRKTEEAVRTFRLSSVASRPAFLEEEEAEAVNIGTATHRFLRLIDLDVFRQENVNMEQAVRAELERMKAEEILTADEARLIRLHGVASFLKSELGQRMLRSKEIRREATFTMRIDPDQPTMVQGIVDCAFKENGTWILIDYKTDKDTEEATFVPRHEQQMNWYREALERLTRVEVREMWLFALRAGTAYPVKRIEITG